MNKILITLTFLLLLISCGGSRNTAQATPDPSTHDYGVLINGIRWATRNVDAPGTFAQNPEDFGMLFQWNRRKGWSAIDEEVEGWDSSVPKGTRWYAENDPCPEGWRVPTRHELHYLNIAGAASENRTGSRRLTKNGVTGRIFGIEPNQIFLPMVRIRVSNGTFSKDDISGSYWGSTQYNREEGSHIGVHTFGISQGGSYRNFGQSIRCVSKETMPLEEVILLPLP